MENFKETFYAILTDKLDVNREALTPEKLFYDLGVDSLDMVELVIEFEKAFSINISDDDADKIKTVGDAEQYLKTVLKIV